MLQRGCCGVTKERHECERTLGAFAGLNSKFYLLGMGSALNCTGTAAPPVPCTAAPPVPCTAAPLVPGTAAPLVLLLAGWRVRVMPLGSVG